MTRERERGRGRETEKDRERERERERKRERRERRVTSSSMKQVMSAIRNVHVPTVNTKQKDCIVFCCAVIKPADGATWR